MKVLRGRLSSTIFVLFVMALGIATSSCTSSVGAPEVPFSPQLAAQAGQQPEVFVLGSAPCGKNQCLQLWKGSSGTPGKSIAFTQLTTPVTYAPSQPSPFPPLYSMVWANDKDGYLMVQTFTKSGLGGTRSFSTTNGGRSWRPVNFESGTALYKVTASDSVFYALLSQCTANGTTCHVSSLASSPAGSRAWSRVPFPSDNVLVSPGGANAAIGATASQVWLTYTSYPSNPTPQLSESNGGRPPFTTIAQPSLGGVVACSLAPMGSGVIWANCPTGMLVTESRSVDRGQHFVPVWTSSGTGGTDFDPVTADVAYRFLGIQSPAVERTTDGGQTFVRVGRLPSSVGTFAHLTFINQQDGFALEYAGTKVSPLVETTDGGATWTSVKF